MQLTKLLASTANLPAPQAAAPVYPALKAILHILPETVYPGAQVSHINVDISEAFDTLQLVQFGLHGSHLDEELAVSNININIPLIHESLTQSS